MKNYLIILLIIFYSCDFINNSSKIPDDLISQEKMIDILYDMSLLSVSKGINKNILENNGMKPKSYILNKHNIDSLQFVISNTYYSNDLEKYLHIYDMVLEKLEFNREIIIDSIQKYKKNRGLRSKEIIQENVDDSTELSIPII
ncbi:MAG: hypothetical protein CMC51_00715 [Flavobacteriaceae bacterium]|nr:hypothetical protein [Flavobacteriaceae bacterium]|tara:strand:+ start:26083 stop:26514 length:432 start_codon:yes stop_codon:yes gene_type:complete